MFRIRIHKGREKICGFQELDRGGAAHRSEVSLEPEEHSLESDSSKCHSLADRLKVTVLHIVLKVVNFMVYDLYHNNKMKTTDLHLS